jgi:hypothetical protein
MLDARLDEAWDEFSQFFSEFLCQKDTPQEDNSIEAMKEQIRNLQEELELIRSRIEA